MELTFEKWEDGRWFVVLPQQKGYLSAFGSHGTCLSAKNNSQACCVERPTK